MLALSIRTRSELKDRTALTAEKFVICTGGHPRRPEFPGSEYAMVPSDLWREGATLPTSAVIVGTGYTGVQIASILADFGCKVHLLARCARLLPREDDDVVGRDASRRSRNVALKSSLKSIASQRITKASERFFVSLRQGRA